MPSGKRKGPRPFIAIDCETDPFDDHQARDVAPFLWCAFDGETVWEWWDDTEGFVDWLRERDCIAYAHNGGRFDFRWLVEHATCGKASIIGSALAAFRIGQCELRDSFLFLRSPLRAIAKDDFDYALLTADRREHNREKIIEYCANDCRHLWHAVKRFERDYGRHATIAGAAVSQYAEIHGEKLPELGRERHAQFAPYFGGGRVTAFERGVIEGPLWLYDIRSAYPWAMTIDHGAGPASHSTRLPEDPCYLATIEAASYGCLPRRGTPAEPLAYDADGIVRTYHTTGHEIAAGLETGTLAIERVADVWTFRDRWDARAYVDRFFEVKAEAERAGDVAGRLFAKLLLNNLYGRLAMDGSRFSDFYLGPPEGDGWELEYVIEGVPIYARPPRVDRYHDVAIGASITGAVRALLWRAIQSLPEGDALYCDTDSILTRSPLPEALLHDQVGGWALEATAERAWIGGRKLYALELADGAGWKTASKGARLSAAEIRRTVETGRFVFNDTRPSWTPKSGVRFLKRTFTADP